MIKQILLSVTLVISSFGADSNDFSNQQMKEFNSFKKSQEEEFKSYIKAQEKALNDYKKELGSIWKEPKLSSKNNWLSYSEDKKTRSDVDFENQYIIVETIASSYKEAKQNLQVALAKAVTIDTKTLQESDPLEKKLAKIKKPDGIISSSVDEKPILSTVVFDSTPTKNSVRNYINKNISNSSINVKNSSKLRHSKIYSVKVKLPKDTMIKRSKIYYNDVVKNAKKQKLPISLIYAIIHSESSFNPRARSHIPAYGLMQIVPKTAGRDTYKFLYNQDKIVSGSYLYNSKNNITMGSGYLHILYYKYLDKIKDPNSRLYCTIAAYNTGAGNIAYAFTKTYNMNQASPIINRLSPKEVYDKLMRSLRYDEPKRYLKKVSARMAAYHKIYGS